MWPSQARAAGLWIFCVFLPVTVAFVLKPGSVAKSTVYPTTRWTHRRYDSTFGVTNPAKYHRTSRRPMTVGNQQNHNQQQPADIRSFATAHTQTTPHAHSAMSAPPAEGPNGGTTVAAAVKRAEPCAGTVTVSRRTGVFSVEAGHREERNGKALGVGLPRQRDSASVGSGHTRRGSMFDNVPVQTMSADGRYTAVLIVPTGIGAAIGGYAGDALPVARAMSSVVDNLVTHPNVMNGAMLYWPEPGMQYVEGYALDEFCAGRWGLLPVTKGGHRVGLILDCAIEEDLILRHVQAANAARATLGINVAEYCITDEPAGVTLEMTKSGASWGTVEGLGSLIAAGRRLVEEAGCTAIAVVARFPDDEDEDALQAYREGQGVDAVGGAEAIISHVMTQELKVPCAHAPALHPIDADESVSPRACAEELGYTFLPCVLANLHRAPSLITSRQHPRAADALWADAVDAVVAPATAFGGAGVLSLAEQATTLLVAVQDNTTVMEAGAAGLLARHSSASRCVTVSSYLEAVGVLAAHKAGVNPACLTTDVPAVRRMQSSSVENAPSVDTERSERHGDDAARRLNGVGLHREAVQSHALAE